MQFLRRVRLVCCFKSKKSNISNDVKPVEKVKIVDINSYSLADDISVKQTFFEKQSVIITDLLDRHLVIKNRINETIATLSSDILNLQKQINKLNKDIFDDSSQDHRFYAQNRELNEMILYKSFLVSKLKEIILALDEYKLECEYILKDYILFHSAKCNKTSEEAINYINQLNKTLVDAPTILDIKLSTIEELLRNFL